MPTYEYSCSACGHEFEVEQRIIEPPIRACAKCKNETASRRISRPSFILKGGGWYADGYSRGGAKPTSTETKGGKESTRSEAPKA